MENELNSHWEVLAEAFQTILRKSKKQDAYEQLKTLTRGQTINAESIAKLLSGLDIPDKDKKTLLSLTPESYIGLATKLVDLM